MPLYEYRCPACQGRFEIIQHLGTLAAETVCPACGAQHVERQLSTFAVASGSMGGGSGASAKSAGESFAGCGGGQCGGGGCGGGDWN
jgi:putative FmdB family regulatory protein